MIVRSNLSRIFPTAACAALALTSGCVMGTEGADPGEDPAEPVRKITYLGAETEALDENLIRVLARTGRGRQSDTIDYANCAAAQAVLDRNDRYFRQIRTTHKREDGARLADAVYLISGNRPDGSMVMVASDVIADCSDAAIATLRGEDG